MPQAAWYFAVRQWLGDLDSKNASWAIIGALMFFFLLIGYTASRRTDAEMRSPP